MTLREHTVVDVRAIDGACAPLAAYARLRALASPWLLESTLRGGVGGRYSFVGADPYAIVRARGGAARVEPLRCVRAALAEPAAEATPLEALRGWLPPPPRAGAIGGAAAALPFVGGAVGYFGYEFGETLDPVGLRARDDLGLPDMEWLLVDRLALFDHALRRAWSIGLGFGRNRATAQRCARRASADLADRLAGLPPEAEPGEAAPLHSARSAAPLRARGAPFDAAHHAKAVDAIREQIAAGNLYQANFTQRADRRFGGDPFELYAALRRRSPAPFAALLELPEVAIVSSSPERFLRVGGDGRVESRPIKGTRRRDADRRRDAALAEDLAHAEKDRAENLMIVDLVRNDLGRVCETGSVRVPALMEIEGYATVWQMVSTVTGRLGPGCDALDGVAAAFPPGSMTGAPKRAAMCEIDRHERVRRGVYAGALGYLDLRGGLDLSVVIRSIFVRAGRAYLHAGGGIVADSEPGSEYRESLDKACALGDALDAVESGER